MLRSRTLPALLPLFLAACGDDPTPAAEVAEAGVLAASAAPASPERSDAAAELLPPRARKIHELLRQGKVDGAWALVQNYERDAPEEAAVYALKAEAWLVSSDLSSLITWYVDPDIYGKRSLDYIQENVRIAADLEPSLKPFLADSIFEAVTRDLAARAGNGESILLSDIAALSPRVEGSVVIGASYEQALGLASPSGDAGLAEGMMNLTESFAAAGILMLMQTQYENYFVSGIWVELTRMARELDPTAPSRWSRQFDAAADAFARIGALGSGVFVVNQSRWLEGASTETHQDASLAYLARHAGEGAGDPGGMAVAIGLAYFGEANRDAIHRHAGEKSDSLNRLRDVIRRDLTPREQTRLWRHLGLRG